MKKLLTVLLTAGFIFMIPFMSVASSISETPSESVYVSESEQNAIYDIIQKSEDFLRFLNNRNLYLLKESITPIHYVQFLDYAETGIFEVYQYGTETFIDGIPTDKGNPVYIAKTVTEKGFGGNIIFYIDNGLIQPTGFFPSVLLEPENTSLVSISYADHAERIARLTNRETYFPASVVRYVIVDRVGECFYINDGEIEALVVISAAMDIFNEDNGEIVYVSDKLRATANERLDEYKIELAAIEEWKVSNPGKNYVDEGFTGGGFMPMYGASKNNIKDILNISEYLASNIAESLSHQSDFQIISDNQSDGIPSATIIGSEVMLIVIAITIILVVVTILITHKRKKQKSK
jgi:hypothetical protein